MNPIHYQNPILRGMYPDPSVVRVGDTFYMVNSTFEYYPGIALSKSTDLINWTKLPSIAQKSDQADLSQAQSNEGIFAVCIRYYEGNFYVITTNFAEWKNFIIRGSFADNKETIIWEEERTEIDIMGIDPDLFFEDGRTYVQFTGYVENGKKALQQVEIDLITGTILHGPEILTYGTGGRDVEGPHILKRNGWYYLLAAEGGTGQGHMVTMFRSQKLWGPYEEAPCNPLFTNRDRADEPLQNIGHADLFQDVAGNWWLTCLGTRPANVGFVHYTNLGRETLLYPVVWSGDWPIIYTGVPTQNVSLTNFPAHAQTVTEQHITKFEDNFTSDKLNPEWVSLRNSLDERLTLKGGTLSLKGADKTLSDLSTPSFLGLRQTEQEEIFTVILNKNKSQFNNGQLGLAILINSNHHAAILLEKTSFGYVVYKDITILDLHIRQKIGLLHQLPDTLTLTHTKEDKIFTLKNEQEEISYTIKAMHFSNEAIAALNTGDFCGLYVLGDAEMVIESANRTKLFSE